MQALTPSVGQQGECSSTSFKFIGIQSQVEIEVTPIFVAFEHAQELERAPSIPYLQIPIFSHPRRWRRP